MTVRDTLKKLGRGLRFAFRELKRLPRDARDHAANLKTEETLVRERLARRYDPSYALNESFERARKAVEAGVMQQAPLKGPGSRDPFINQHYEYLRRNPPPLTPQQEAALAVQRRTLGINLKQDKNG